MSDAAVFLLFTLDVAKHKRLANKEDFLTPKTNRML